MPSSVSIFGAHAYAWNVDGKVTNVLKRKLVFSPCGTFRNMSGVFCDFIEAISNF